MINLRPAVLIGALAAATMSLAPATAAPIIDAASSIATPAGTTDAAAGAMGGVPAPREGAIGDRPMLPSPGGAGQIVTVATIASDLSIVPVEMPMPERAGTMTDFRLPADVELAAQQGMSTVFGPQSFSRLRSFVPELSTWIMMIAGLALVGLYIRRRRTRPALPPPDLDPAHTTL